MKADKKKKDESTKISDVKVTDTKMQEDKAPEIKMPGTTQVPGANAAPAKGPAPPVKKPMIQVIKKRPTFAELYSADNTQMQFIVTVEKESSAKDIDVQVSERFIIL